MDLLTTLHAYLKRANKTNAAAELRLQRQSLYQRLTKVLDQLVIPTGLGALAGRQQKSLWSWNIPGAGQGPSRDHLPLLRPHGIGLILFY